jgi:gliding motility-associated-like protein
VELIYTHSIDSSVCFWDFNGAHQSGMGNDTITAIIDAPLAEISLIVDEYGCKSAPAETILKRLPHFDFYTEFEEGCQPYSPVIIAAPGDENLTFTWLNDSTIHPIGDSLTYHFADSGMMDISVLATSELTGCFDTLTKTDWIWVHPKPVSAFEVDFPVALLENATITYTNLSENAETYLWEFGDEEQSNEVNPRHTFMQLGEYNSVLFVESEYGCRDTSEFEIQILPFTVFTPNAFRPDSDIDENRTFMPLGVGADPNRFNLKIYDRWGQIVFETDSPDIPWDGTNKNGNPAPMGNYVWISNYYDIQGYEHNQKGQVMLVR